MHSQHNLLLPGAVLVESRGYGPELRKGDCFPFTILNMAVLTTLLVSQAGGTSIVMDRIDAEGVAEWIRRERVTTWNGPPALLHSLAHRDDIDPSDLASLDEVWTGGADCPEAIRSAFEAKFGLPVLATYGLSEAPTVVAIDGRRGDDHVPGGSGRPLPHLAVRIAGDDGASLPAGEAGEICVGPADDRYRTMLGYWQRPDATAETLAGGELRTGDIGFLDEDGRLHVRDRKSLVILRGGANVYPAEVERVLLDHPAVDAGAVLGVPDERLGERVAAVVEVTAGAELDVDDVRAHLLANLARYKVPEQIAVVDALPRNAMGKIVRTELPDAARRGGRRAELPGRVQLGPAELAGRLGDVGLGRERAGVDRRQLDLGEHDVGRQRVEPDDRSRHLVDPERPHREPHVVEHRRRHRTGGHDVDGDAVPLDLLGERTGEGVQPRLRRRVRRPPRLGRVGGRRRQEHEPARPGPWRAARRARRRTPRSGWCAPPTRSPRASPSGRRCRP